MWDILKKKRSLANARLVSISDGFRHYEYGENGCFMEFPLTSMEALYDSFFRTGTIRDGLLDEERVIELNSEFIDHVYDTRGLADALHATNIVQSNPHFVAHTKDPVWKTLGFCIDTPIYDILEGEVRIKFNSIYSDRLELSILQPEEMQRLQAESEQKFGKEAFARYRCKFMELKDIALDTVSITLKDVYAGFIFEKAARYGFSSVCLDAEAWKKADREFINDRKKCVRAFLAAINVVQECSPYAAFSGDDTYARNLMDFCANAPYYDMAMGEVRIQISQDQRALTFSRLESEDIQRLQAESEQEIGKETFARYRCKFMELEHIADIVEGYWDLGKSGIPVKINRHTIYSRDGQREYSWFIAENAVRYGLSSVRFDAEAWKRADEAVIDWLESHGFYGKAALTVIQEYSPYAAIRKDPSCGNKITQAIQWGVENIRNMTSRKG